MMTKPGTSKKTTSHPSLFSALALIAAALLSSGKATASPCGDEFLPTMVGPRSFHSPNGEYTFTIISWRDFGEFEMPALGQLRYNSHGKATALWTRALLSKPMPRDVIVGDEGNWVITFNELQAYWDGNNAVVAYDRRGEPTTRLSLDDFLVPEHLQHIEHCGGNVEWYCDDHRIGEDEAVLSVKRFQGDRECVPMRLNLSTGDFTLEDVLDKLLPQDVQARLQQETLKTCPCGGRMTPEQTRQVARTMPPAIGALLEASLVEGDINAKRDWAFKRLEELIASGADINAVNNWGETALTLMEGDPETGLFLIEHGADPTITSDGDIPLIQAIKSGSAELVRAMLRAGADPNTKDSMRTAARQCNAEIVEALIRAGADLENRHDDQSPLDTALRSGCWASAEVLLDRGASKYNLTKAGKLLLAIHEARTSMVQELLADDHSEPISDRWRKAAVFAAARLGRADELATLLEQGEKANIRTGDADETPLMVAALAGHLDTAMLLMAHGADINATDRAGYSVADMARLSGNEELVKFIEAQGGVAMVEVADIAQYRQ